MATLHVRNVPDELYEAIQGLAAREHRSIGAEVTHLLQTALEQEALRNRRVTALERATRRRRSFKSPVEAAESLALLREDRTR